MDTRSARRMTVTIEADAFQRLAVLAARERRAVRDQAAVELEKVLRQQDRQPVEAGAHQ